MALGAEIHGLSTAEYLGEGQCIIPWLVWRHARNSLYTRKVTPCFLQELPRFIPTPPMELQVSKSSNMIAGFLRQGICNVGTSHLFYNRLKGAFRRDQSDFRIASPGTKAEVGTADAPAGR